MINVLYFITYARKYYIYYFTNKVLINQIERIAVYVKFILA